MSPRDALTAVERFAWDKEIDQLLLDLLRYPSVQTERLEADPSLKTFVAEMIAPRLAELTGKAGAIDAMGNLIWRFGRTTNENSNGFLLMGYAMTFPAASMKEPFSGALVDGKAFAVAGQCALGRGACEQKGALAAMIYAAAIVASAPSTLRAPLILAVSLAGETGRHDAAKFILETTRSARARPSLVWGQAIESASATKAVLTSKSSSGVSPPTAACPKKASMRWMVFAG